MTSLAMAKPLAEATFATMDLDSVVGWLSTSTSDLKEVQPEDPANADRRVLLIVASPGGLYGHTNFTADQRVAMAVVYVPPYVRHTLSSWHYDSLNILEARRRGGSPTRRVCSSESSQGVEQPPLQTPTPCGLTTTGRTRGRNTTQCSTLGLQGFPPPPSHSLPARVSDQAKECICTPRGPGHTGHFRLSTPERSLPRAKNVATLVSFAAPSDNHWALTMDQVFDSALAQLAQNRLDKESAAGHGSLGGD